ncbi:hypothetical protein B0I35DRAFT_442073 [Stachybotrys elegans]|uniref:Uncharacterized protein n=1 Tax=Stachybotrys elegans TaxID=80388 RepID=A0A8K0SFI8_9HYPO|nr:hypothetical protein B0I35DRAFT_442073 [Stachybotrys elegans]
MCYFDQIRWACGYWRWGRHRQHCNKEYRIGETCGLKLVYETRAELDVCKLCHSIEKKQRRYDKMYRDIQRWRETQRHVDIGRIHDEMGGIIRVISVLGRQHNSRIMDLDYTQTSEENWPHGPIFSPPSPSALSSTMSLFDDVSAASSESGNEEGSAAGDTDACYIGDRGATPSIAASNASHPPQSIMEALARKDVNVLATFLESHFDQASEGSYAWIAELKDMGYTIEEITQLLYERNNDSPWIYFEAPHSVAADIKPDHHLSGCPHEPHSTQQDTCRTFTLKTDLDQEVIRKVEQFCGLGGVSPSSRDKSNWNGTAEFRDENSTVFIRHPSHDAPDAIHCLLRVVQGFISAVGTVQDAGLCCDSFTILKIARPATDIPELQLSRIKFGLVEIILSALRVINISREGSEYEQNMTLLKTASLQIIKHFVEINTDYEPHVLDLTSLAVQLLCIGFLSYTQAHVGVLQPFFLDSPLQRIVLQGTKSMPDDFCVTATLVELSCLSGMCQGPVLAFCSLSYGSRMKWKYDIRASLINVLDTWGPGEVVTRSTNRRIPLAIRIGGGYIRPLGAGDKYHWDLSINITADSPPLDMNGEVLIGQLVTVNSLCILDEARSWEASSGIFEELGTYDSYSELAERQFGLQGGPDYLAMTTHMTWAKRRGKTVKSRNLDREDYLLVPFLEFHWGVRVSFCTGVAQRVPLRQLVADLLPAFSACLTSPTTKLLWMSLESRQVLEQFRSQDSLSSWLSGLPEEMYRFVLVLIRQILETLRDTGLSPDRRYFSVAWPCNGVVNRCLRMSLEDCKWTPMLADSDDCATFAYVSDKCLEAKEKSCQGPNPKWQGQIHLLETAVLSPASSGPWTLCHEQTYFFQKLDNTLFWVKARKDTSGMLPALVRLLSIESLPRDVIRRLLFTDEKKRQRRLRERDLSCVVAETVAVL